MRILELTEETKKNILEDLLKRSPNSYGEFEGKVNDIIENEPNVTGVVEEVHENYIVMYSETADGYPNGSRWSISLNVENKDSYTDVVVGDEIVVYYDGMAAETDPLEVSTVYAITLKTPADRTENDKS